jgi:uncharacterized protein YbdZ (MbtH family)
MSERAPYSRVYWAVVDDPKFATIYGDDHHLATWLRLLMAADALWPASCSLPANARKASVKALSDAGLIDILPFGFRVRGLDAERGRRREAARSGTGRHPDGTPPVPSGVQDAGPKPSYTETHRAEPSRAQGARNDPAPPRPSTVDRDPLLRQIRDANLERNGLGMDEESEKVPAGWRRIPEEKS